MNRKVTLKVGMSPTKRITTVLQEERSMIIVGQNFDNGCHLIGGNGTIVGQILNKKTIELGFVLIRETMTQQDVEINPRYIGSIKKVNVTRVEIEHSNNNYPSSRRTEWYSHSVGTEIEFKEGNFPSIDEGKRFGFLNLKTLKCDDHIEDS